MSRAAKQTPGRSFDKVIAFGVTASEYRRLRQSHPGVRASTVLRFVRDDHGLTLEQYVCEQGPGHEWVHTGTAHGGEDEEYHGDGRAYCCRCGADGDA